MSLDDLMPKDNDIVKFLRLLAVTKGAEYSTIELTAADEIERLRKYIALLSLTVEMQTKELNELKNN